MNRIRDMRIKKGWRQEDLAEKMNTSKSVISRYESEKHGLSADVINALCDLFDCTADYLLGRSIVPKEGISADDAELLRLYHAVQPSIQDSIRTILQSSVPHSKSEVS